MLWKTTTIESTCASSIALNQIEEDWRGLNRTLYSDVSCKVAYRESQRRRVRQLGTGLIRSLAKLRKRSMRWKEQEDEVFL